MNPLETFVESWGLRRNINLLALIVFLLHLALVSPEFFPPLTDIGVWDESFYINEGRDLLNGKLPTFTYNPAVAGLYALTYLPVHASPNWLVHSCWIGRLLLFSMLWLGSFLVACQLAELASPFIMIALVTVSPVFVSLLNNGSNALFAAMSGFALWQFLSFYRTRNLKHLWLCSLFLGLAALSRNEGNMIFLAFLGLSLALCVPAGLVRKGLTACVVPFTVLVGGYILLYGLVTGDFKPGITERSYYTFEMGHGMAFSESYGTKQFYVEGQVDARRLFGTPEENHFSVLTAIRRNPMAYLRRILPLAKHASKDAVGGYGWYFGLFCFAFAARGIIDLVTRKSYVVLATLLLWSVYGVLYVLLCYQPSHLLMPFLTVFSLAAVGISAFTANLISRRERYLWSAGLGACAIVAAAGGRVPSGPLVATLTMFFGFWLIWFVIDRNDGVQNRRTIGCLILLSVALILMKFVPPSRAQGFGSSPDDKAALYLREHFRAGTRVGAWGPGKIWNAKLEFVFMVGELRQMKSAQDVSEWMAREKVTAIYADDYLRKYEPDVWDTLQKQIGNGLSVAFDAGEGAVQVLVRTPSE